MIPKHLQGLLKTTLVRYLSLIYIESHINAKKKKDTLSFDKDNTVSSKPKPNILADIIDQDCSLDLIKNLTFSQDLYINDQSKPNFDFQKNDIKNSRLDLADAKYEYLTKRSSIESSTDAKEISISKKFIKSKPDDHEKSQITENITENSSKIDHSSSTLQHENLHQSLTTPNQNISIKTFFNGKSDFLTEAQTFQDNIINDDVDLNLPDITPQNEKHYDNFLVQNKENFDKLSCSSFSDSENTQSKSNYQWLNTISNASPNITTETQTKIPENGIAIDENFDVTPEERFEEFKSVVHSLLKKNNTDQVENTEPKNFADPKNIPIKNTYVQEFLHI